MADIVARARAALEDTYSALYDSLLVAELVAEVERLREIPAEVRAARELATHSALPLGEALEACGIVAERDQLKAAVERVRLLAEHPTTVLVHAGGGNLVSRVVMVNPSEILAALDGDDGKGES